MRLRGAVWLAVVLAPACAARAPVRTDPLPVEVPAAWSAGPAAGVEIDREWWRAFGDARLDELVRLARERNPDLAAAMARVEQAEARSRIVAGERKPRIDAAFDAARRRQNFIGLPIGPSGILTSTSTSLGLGVATSWEADLWGRLRAGVAASLADLEAAGFDRDALLLAIEARTAKAWFAVEAARMQLELAEATAASYGETAELVRARYETGLRSALDLRLALAQRARAETLAASRRRELDAGVRGLEVLVGSYPHGALSAGNELPLPPRPVAAGLPSDLIARRPDLRAAERRLASALDAFAEVESALAAEALLAERETAASAAVEHSRAAERLALERYRSGLGDYFAVLESQTRALEAEVERIASRRARLEVRVDLHLALGGGLVDRSAGRPAQGDRPS